MYLIVYLVNYKKAFDRVKYDKTIRILKEIVIDEEYLRIIVNLY